jgi:tight adherence protein B
VVTDVLFLGLSMVVLAVGCVAYLLLVQPRVAIERRSAGPVTRRSTVEATSDKLVSAVDVLLTRRGWAPFTAAELEIAGVAASVPAVVTTVLVLGATLGAAVIAVTGNALLAVLLGVAVPTGTKIAFVLRASRRRAAFADQMQDSLQLIAAALRAGQSLARALDSVSREAPPPMSTEMARVVNENRLGRDLVVAMEGTADRMQSDDFRWIAEAVAIQRQSGGNLNEVLDRVSETLRERAAIREKVKSLAAEGVFSAIIIMALPLFVMFIYVLTNRTYAEILFTTKTGIIAMTIGAVMYVVGGLWMRSIVKVKV